MRSRHRFVYPTFEETTARAIEACEAAWEFFGGIFKVLIPDNTKAIIVAADPLAPRITPAFLEYAQARHFHIDPARVRHARDKGRVERAVPGVRDDCFAGEVLTTLDDARAWGRHWCLNDYGLRRHSRTQRRPLEHFQAEEQGLLPAPTTPYDIPLWSEPKVGRDQLAAVDKALYSIPHPYVGQRITARADAQIVRFYARGLLIKTHPRKAPGGQSIDASDYPVERSVYAMRNVEALRRQAEAAGEVIGRYAAALLDSPLPWTRMRRVYALLGLVRRYGAARVTEVCTIALDADMLDVHRLKRMLEQGVTAPPLPAARASSRPRAISAPPRNTNCRSPPRPLKERSPNDDPRCHQSDLKTVLRRLKLSRMLDTLPERLTLARQQKMPHQDLLLQVLSDEVARRDSLAVTLRVQKARLDPTMRSTRGTPPRRSPSIARSSTSSPRCASSTRTPTSPSSAPSASARPFSRMPSATSPAGAAPPCSPSAPTRCSRP